jgi:transposase
MSASPGCLPHRPIRSKRGALERTSSNSGTRKYRSMCVSLAGMRPYSKDLRSRVLAAVDAGTPREEVARTFSVSMPTIKRWIKRRRETGEVQPRAIPGRPSREGAMLKEWLPEHLQANHDLTLEEHRQAFEEEFGEEVSPSTVGRTIAGLPDGGWPLKKSHR